MEGLITQGNAVAPLKRKRGGAGGAPAGSGRSPSSSHHKHSVSSKPQSAKQKQDDPTLHSIASSTRIAPIRASKSTSNRQIKDLKLRAHLNQLDSYAKESRELTRDAGELLLQGTDAGLLVPEDVMEKTWRVDQEEIVKSIGMDAAQQRKEWTLDGGPYRTRYTRNGRHIAFAGRNGHVASFDWKAGKLHFELQLRENIRDITYLYDQSHVAVAQKQHVFIYDIDGVEIHRLSTHIDVTRLEFLPYHWLLASVGNAGYLKYTDTTTGTLVSEQRTKLGACRTMAQNVHNAVIYLGHQNGTITLHTPNLPTPPVTLLAHLGPVTSISVDASTGGRYMASSGADGRVKVWDCRNWKGCVREWTPRSQGGSGSRLGAGGMDGGIEVEWSQKGILGVASGGSVYLYTPPTIRNEHKGAPPPVYITHPIPHRPLTSLRFCPFTDVLTIGHSKGLSSILVPGAGEPNFDSTEADPFENPKARQEREVRALLDKIQPDLITLSDDFAGRLATQSSTIPDDDVNVPKVMPSYSNLSRLDRLKASGRADLTEEHVNAVADGADDADSDDDITAHKGANAPGMAAKREPKAKVKQRGKNKSLSRYLRKKRKNVIDPSSVAIRQKIEAQKERRRQERTEAGGGGVEAAPQRSALDRFKKK